MAKKKHNQNKTGPLYRRYLFAYSDRMILSKLLDPTTLIQAAIRTPFFTEIKLDNSLIAIEFPQTTGDARGNYGAVAMPNDHLRSFLDDGPKYIPKKLSARELNPSIRGLVYLEDLNLTHSSLGDLGEDIADIWEGNKIIPYRLSINDLPINEQLADAGYNLVCSFDYSRKKGAPLQMLGFPSQPARETQPLRMHFYRINRFKPQDPFLDVFLRQPSA